MSLSMWNDPFFSNPWPQIRRMQRDMDTLFSGRDSDDSLKVWSPTSDLRETEKEFILHAELPGLKKEDVNIELKEGILTISGERKNEKKEENEKYHCIERSYGRFSRSVAVPSGVKEDDIKAKFTDGVLEVTFPKPQKALPEKKRIAIE